MKTRNPNAYGCRAALDGHVPSPTVRGAGLMWARYSAPMHEIEAGSEVLKHAEWRTNLRRWRMKVARQKVERRPRDTEAMIEWRSAIQSWAEMLLRECAIKAAAKQRYQEKCIKLIPHDPVAYLLADRVESEQVAA